MTFIDRLEAAMTQTGTPALVGLDPNLDLLPEEFAAARDPEATPNERAAIVEDFLTQVIELVAGRVPAIKPQSAFFELLGAPGAQVWENTVKRAHEHGLLVIGDIKRGDIASTAEAYARAFLEGLPNTDPDTLCDAVTLNPFLGAESIQPFVDVCARTGRGLYLLVRTSNPGRKDYQTVGQPELSYRIAADVHRFGQAQLGACGLSNIGAVVGATNGQELSSFRQAMPKAPFLLPGFGAQGATAEDVAPAFLKNSEHQHSAALVNSSRGILFAHRSTQAQSANWKDASKRALDDMIAALAHVRS